MHVMMTVPLRPEVKKTGDVHPLTWKRDPDQDTGEDISLMGITQGISLHSPFLFLVTYSSRIFHWKRYSSLNCSHDIVIISWHLCSHYIHCKCTIAAFDTPQTTKKLGSLHGNQATTMYHVPVLVIVSLSCVI